jgi:hypothetical protein
MAAALHIARVGLVLATVLAGFVLFSEATGGVFRDDWRLARAIVEDRTVSTDATRQDLEAATRAFHKRRLMELAVEVLLFAAGCSGIYFTTRAIRARANASCEATSTI